MDNNRGAALENAVVDEEIDLFEVISFLWSRKVVIVAVTFLFGICSVLYALSLKNEYRSSAKLASTLESGGLSGRLGQLASSYSGLASMAGIDLGGGSADKSALALSTIVSRDFFEEYLYRETVIELFAVDDWDPEKNELTLDLDVFDQSKGWTRPAAGLRSRKPSAQEAHKEFLQLLTVDQDTGTGIVTLSITHLSPFVAERWLNLLIDSINEAMRAKDIEDAENSLEYLRNQVEETALIDMNQVFFDLIEEQTKTLMLANVEKEYAFRTVESPVVAEERASPNRALIAIVGTVIGGLLAVFALLLFLYVEISKNRSS